MYKVVKKLKLLKTELKALHIADFIDIEAQFMNLKRDLNEIQLKVHQNYNDDSLRELESNTLKEFQKVNESYFSFLSQKAKIKWLQIGDENSAYFHRSLQMRKFKKSVIAIKDCDGVWCDTPNQISDAFVNYYKKLLGVDLGDRVPAQQEIVRQGFVLSDEQDQMLCAPFQGKM
uniref:Uncharacterized protein n=1 Tax=Chenopodium quinoa TaxID=63459 RepID=A0A803LVG8_CHEQI